MSTFRRGMSVTLAGLVCIASVDAASARVLRRHRVARRIVPHFVFASPAAAASAGDLTAVGARFEAGIFGASTADPYETPAVGYDGRGYYGPGFAYPGY